MSLLEMKYMKIDLSKMTDQTKLTKLVQLPLKETNQTTLITKLQLLIFASGSVVVAVLLL